MCKLPSSVSGKRIEPLSDPRFCGECGAALSSSERIGQPCPGCDAPLQTILELPAQSLVPSHQQALKEAVDEKVQGGWYIVRQREDFVEMRKPKGQPNPALLGAALAAGVPLPGLAVFWGGAYLAWHAIKNEPAIHLFVGRDDQVREERAG